MRVLVYKFVCHHESRNGDPKLAARIGYSYAITFFEAINIVERQHNDGLADLGRFEELLHKMYEDGRDRELEPGGLGITMGKIG